MGSPSCFYGGRRTNAVTSVKVVYASGRIELHSFSTKTAAMRSCEKFEELHTVVSADIITARELKQLTKSNGGR